MFTHLHNHFKGSFFDSIIDDKKAFEKINSDNNKGLAITDHGQMNYVVKFSNNARKLGIKPLLGMEFYFVEDATETINTKDNFRNHLVLIAKNSEGFKNLVKLNNISWKDNYFQRTPTSTLRGLLDWNMIEEYNKGLICLTACFFGSLPYKVINSSRKDVEREYLKYKDIFGDDLYLEMSYHGIPEEKIANEGIEFLIKKYNQKGVITQDSHYLNQDDYKTQDILINTRFGYSSNFHFKSKDYYLKNENEMRELGFKEEYFNTTNEVYEKVNFDIIEFYKEIKNDFLVHGTEKGKGSKFIGEEIPFSTWKTLGLKETLRRTNLVVGYSDNFMDKVYNAIPDFNKSLKENLIQSDELRDNIESSHKKLFAIAQVLEDFYIDFKALLQYKIRAKSDKKILDYFPVVRIQDYNGLLMQYDLESMKILGFL